MASGAVTPELEVMTNVCSFQKLLSIRDKASLSTCRGRVSVTMRTTVSYERDGYTRLLVAAIN